MNLPIFESMDAAQLRQYIRFLLWHYRVLDSFWYLNIAERFDEPTADRLNESVWERIAAMAHRYNALMVDWRYPSALTRDDTRYWDPLHYRLPVASGIVRTLEAASRGETSKDGSWTVLSRPAP